jgi:group I intron endonuclease
MRSFAEKLSGENHYMFGKIHNLETKEKISASMKGIRLSEEHKKNLSLAHPNSPKIGVLDLENYKTTSYNSIREVVRAFNCDHSSIRYYIKSKNHMPFRGKYVFFDLLG